MFGSEHPLELFAAVPLGAAIVLLGWTFLMSIGPRRSLAGTLLEARIKYFLVRHSWFLASTAAALAVLTLLRSRSFLAAIFLLVGAIICGSYQIPKLQHFAYSKAIVMRLAYNLWRLRGRIQRSRTMAVRTDSFADRIEGVRRETLSPEETRLREEIDQRFVLGKQKYLSKPAWMIEQASLMAAVTSVQEDLGKYFPFVEPVSIALMYAFSLGLFCLGIGVSLTLKAETEWQVLCVTTGVVAVVATATYLAIAQKQHQTLECLVCRTKTRRRMVRGDVRPPICSDACERRIQYLYGTT